MKKLITFIFLINSVFLVNSPNVSASILSKEDLNKALDSIDLVIYDSGSLKNIKNKDEQKKLKLLSEIDQALRKQIDTLASERASHRLLNGKHEKKEDSNNETAEEQNSKLKRLKFIRALNKAIVFNEVASKSLKSSDIIDTLLHKLKAPSMAPVRDHLLKDLEIKWDVAIKWMHIKDDSNLLEKDDLNWLRTALVKKLKNKFTELNGKQVEGSRTTSMSTPHSSNGSSNSSSSSPSLSPLGNPLGSSPASSSSSAQKHMVSSSSKNSLNGGETSSNSLIENYFTIVNSTLPKNQKDKCNEIVFDYIEMKLDESPENEHKSKDEKKKERLTYIKNAELEDTKRIHEIDRIVEDLSWREKLHENKELVYSDSLYKNVTRVNENLKHVKERLSFRNNLRRIVTVLNGVGDKGYSSVVKHCANSLLDNLLDELRNKEDSTVWKHFEVDLGVNRSVVQTLQEEKTREQVLASLLSHGLRDELNEESEGYVKYANDLLKLTDKRNINNNDTLDVLNLISMRKGHDSDVTLKSAALNEIIDTERRFIGNQERLSFFRDENHRNYFMALLKAKINGSKELKIKGRIEELEKKGGFLNRNLRQNENDELEFYKYFLNPDGQKRFESFLKDVGNSAVNQVGQSKELLKELIELFGHDNKVKSMEPSSGTNVISVDKFRKILTKYFDFTSGYSYSSNLLKSMLLRSKYLDPEIPNEFRRIFDSVYEETCNTKKISMMEEPVRKEEIEKKEESNKKSQKISFGSDVITGAPDSSFNTDLMAAALRGPRFKLTLSEANNLENQKPLAIKQRPIMDELVGYVEKANRYNTSQLARIEGLTHENYPTSSLDKISGEILEILKNKSNSDSSSGNVNGSSSVDCASDSEGVDLEKLPLDEQVHKRLQNLLSDIKVTNSKDIDFNPVEYDQSESHTYLRMSRIMKETKELVQTVNRYDSKSKKQILKQILNHLNKVIILKESITPEAYDKLLVKPQVRKKLPDNFIKLVEYLKKHC